MSSRKRKADVDSTDEHDDNKNGEAMKKPPSNGDEVQEDQLSPEMMLRSGRTKRRKRSTAPESDAEKEDNKSTPAKRNKQSSEQSADEKGDSDIDDDEDMKDEEEQQSVEDEEDGAFQLSAGDQKVVAATEPASHPSSNGNHHYQHLPASATRATPVAAATLTVVGTSSSLDTDAIQVPTAAAASAAAKRLPTVERLKLPSQHTPGRPIHETERLVVKRLDPLAVMDSNNSDVQQQQQQQPRRLVLTDDTTTTAASSDDRATTAHVAPPLSQQQPQVNLLAPVDGREQPADLFQQRAADLLQQLYHYASQGLVRIQESLQQVLAPRQEAPVHEVVDDDTAAAAAAPAQQYPLHVDLLLRHFDKEYAAKHLQKTWVWFMLFLVFLTSLDLFIHPALSSAVNLARVAIPFYKGLVPRQVERPDASSHPSPVETEQQAIQQTRNLMTRSSHLRVQLATIRETLFQDLAALENESTKLISFTANDNTSASNRKRDERRQRLQEQIDRLEETVQTVHGILDGVAQDGDEENEATILSSAATLADIQTALGPEGTEFLLDLQSIQLPDFTSKQTEGDEQGACALLARNDVATALKQLKAEINKDTDDIKADGDMTDVAIEWALQDVEEQLQQALAAVTQQNDQQQQQTPKPSHRVQGSSLASVQKMIDARLQMESADRTGKVDHAAIYNGAKVITWGEHTTSPSLVDNLPLWNRLASALGIRFYGYGPEAALTPTFPLQALGQCWSFEQHEMSGGFATLAISLARPIVVTSVSIEHPPREITDQANSAIRTFRVLGFENSDASGKAWEIGSFQYQSEGDMKQEFDTDKMVGDNVVPPLQSISLAIESTWGMSYACLYRLRVHGDLAEEEYGEIDAF